jgi:hypothetical protein
MVPDSLCRAVDAKIKKKHDRVNGATSFDSVAVGRPNVKKPTNTALRKSARLEAFIILLSDHVRFAQIPLEKPSSIRSEGSSQDFEKDGPGSFGRLLGRHAGRLWGQHFRKRIHRS